MPGSLREGKAPWNTATGLVVRGYVSKIDGSVQPYGLVVPASYQPNTPHQFRLDVWCHGRGENLSELSFINGRQSSPGEFTPPNAFVLHPYGRYCNANKFAGEIDLFEALDDVKKHYPIDEDRLVMRGFSMGGAACWQFAVHYPGIWAAAAPGAGFSETADFLKVFQNETVQPTWYEKKLWHLYDCTDYALNLFNCPTVAYSGEIDRQKQAADMMAQGAGEGRDRAGPHHRRQGRPSGTRPRPRHEINRRIDSIVRVGRDPVPVKVRFTTWTLRYNRSFWVQVDGLEQHWEQARVDADLFGRDGLGPEVMTKNVSALTLTMPPGQCPPELDTKPSMTIDGEKVDARGALSDRSWTAHFRKVDGNWQPVDSARRRHASQAARPARADRRRLHGQLPDGPADRSGLERKSRQLGRRRDATTPSTTGGASSAARRASRTTRTSPRPTSPRHQSHPLGRPEQQRAAGEDRRQAAGAVGQGRACGSATRVSTPAITCRC